MKGNGKASAALVARLLAEPPRWSTEPGPVSDVILSSRIRFARNLSSIPFPGRATSEQQGSVVSRVRRAVAEGAGFAEVGYLACETLTAEDMLFLVERRLVSRDLLHGGKHRGVLIAEGEDLSIMINEEDHLRLQSVASGLRLGEALDRVGSVEGRLDASLNYAFDDRLGFLTACPTNVGTGMRASVLAHLPALVLTRRAKKVIQGVRAMGLAVRGFYGEGTEVMGNFFQISNQTTLGRNEHQIVSRLEEVVRQILGYEEEARDHMWSNARTLLEDKIHRAHATLRSARLLAAEEVVSLASAVRFGVSLELAGLCSLSALNEILIFAQPGHVTRRAGRELTQEQRRKLRADYVRERLDAAEREPTPRRPGISTEDSPRGEEQ